ncbi:MAG TPA: hypothetical protein VGP26_24005 [Actinophytocola sp.]|nr:hypothetical protein [Actinophytocola sp.]
MRGLRRGHAVGLGRGRLLLVTVLVIGGRLLLVATLLVIRGRLLLVTLGGRLLLVATLLVIGRRLLLVATLLVIRGRLLLVATLLVIRGRLLLVISRRLLGLALLGVRESLGAVLAGRGDAHDADGYRATDERRRGNRRDRQATPRMTRYLVS